MHTQHVHINDDDDSDNDATGIDGHTRLKKRVRTDR